MNALPIFSSTHTQARMEKTTGYEEEIQSCVNGKRGGGGGGGEKKTPKTINRSVCLFNDRPVS